jgi:hypothetical protein
MRRSRRHNGGGRSNRRGWNWSAAYRRSRGSCDRRSHDAGRRRNRRSRRHGGRRTHHGRCRLCFHRRGCRTRRRRRGSWSGGVLLLADDSLQHIARLGDVGEINFGLDLIGGRLGGTTRFRRCRGAVAAATQIPAHLLGFMLFQRTRVGFLLGDAHQWQGIENSFAFYFQLSGQIVNSNLTHPPVCSSELSR